MPSRPRPPCSTPGCAHLTPCPEHRRQAEQRRGSGGARGSTTRWRAFRAAYLADHPWCECDTCLALPVYRRPRAVDVHHRDGCGRNGPRSYDPANIIALTHDHHAAVTSHDQPGGWAAEQQSLRAAAARR